MYSRTSILFYDGINLRKTRSLYISLASLTFFDFRIYFMNTRIGKKYYVRSWKWFFVDTAACDILVVLGFITRECGYSKFSKVSTVAKESSDHNKWERLQNTKNIFLRLRKKPSPPAHVVLKPFHISLLLSGEK